MRRLLATVTLLAALVAAWALASPASAQPPSRRVILVLAPYLTWEDLTATSTPTIWSLAEKGAIGDINSRSRTRLPGEPPSPLEGALTISAGAWAVPSAEAAAAYRADEPYEVGTAAEAFRRTTGDHVGKNRIVFLGMPITQSVNSERSFDAVLGILGQTVVDAGGVTGAIGNSDVGYVTAQQRRVRPAALAAMDEDGLVALGDVSTRMLREDPNAPFGFETDLKAFERRAARLGARLGRGRRALADRAGCGRRLPRGEVRAAGHARDRSRAATARDEHTRQRCGPREKALP